MSTETTPTEIKRAKDLGRLYDSIAAIFTATTDHAYARADLAKLTEAHMRLGYPASDVAWMLEVVAEDLRAVV